MVLALTLVVKLRTPKYTFDTVDGSPPHACGDDQKHSNNKKECGQVVLHTTLSKLLISCAMGPKESKIS